MKPIYLDYNATMPTDKEVAEAMLPYLTGHFGNPSSTHEYGIIANKAVRIARKQIAGLIHCKPHEIIFTSGGTESNNFAIKGAALANRKWETISSLRPLSIPLSSRFANILKEAVLKLPICPLMGLGG